MSKPNTRKKFSTAFVNRYKEEITNLKNVDTYSVSSDTTSVRLEKKRQRKDARRQARLARE